MREIWHSSALDILDVNGLNEPTLAENAIDELVMRPERNKEMIKAIVKTYTDIDAQADLTGVDFIRGKGEGQIFLLHGPPGTGKTLTAGKSIILFFGAILTSNLESVAEYTKRPLLSITAADLGHEPIELERNLLRFFKNAAAWDAIVLLDEADIYLARRSSKDLRRNSIVSSKSQ
jgi:SpoVK/Ycf46/Vps4 family AAA+-type ATPase